MEYKVNEVFELLGHKLRAEKAPNTSCDGCWLHRQIGCMFRGLKCDAEDRRDKTNVIYKKVDL